MAAGVKELRIHGVGGSPGERLLGLDHPDDAIIAAEGVGTVFLARRADRSVEGYDWGGLTSGSSLQPLWVLLLPFTLLNVAGWMHPRTTAESRGRVWWIVRTVHFLCGCMTATWVLYASVAAIDLFGYQWTRRVAELEWVRELRWPDVTADAGTHGLQYVGMSLGALAVAGLMILIWRIAGNTQKAFEGRTATELTLDPADDPAPWRLDEDLFDGSFFSHPRAAKRRLVAHAIVAAATFAGALAWAAWMVNQGEPRLQFGRLLLILGGLEFLGVGLLGVLSFKRYAEGTTTPPRMMPAAAAGLGFALTNAVFSGLILFAEKALTKKPALPETASVLRVRGGPELLLTDLWFLLVLASIAMTVWWIFSRSRRGSDEGIDDRTSPPGHELDGADPVWKRTIARMRGLAIAAETAPVLLRRIVVVFFVFGLFFSLIRFDANGTWAPWKWGLSLVSLDRNDTWAFWEWRLSHVPDEKTNVLWDAGAWFLTALPGATIALVYLATRQKTARRTVGILWDVLTFWPRRFHPFAVRPYSERAVVELQGRMKLLARSRPVVVSAHSQGSILAFAALAPLDDEVRANVALVTYGSPIRTLYGAVFPAYFGPGAVERLRSSLLDERLAVRWRNFYRDTDPIGGPVFEPVAGSDEASDVKIDDPAEAPRADDVPEEERGVEPSRMAWSNVAGHSHYLREECVQAWVRSVKTTLSQGG